MEITSHCNLHCPQCPRYTEDGYLHKHLNQGHLKFEDFQQNFDLNLLPNLSYVKFEGDYGDCMMHPQINQFINFFDCVNNLELITNGSIRNTKWWGNLANQKNVVVTFSIDGLENTNHIYRIGAKWKNIMNNANAFIGNGGKAKWKFIVFKHNQHQIEQAKKLAKTMGFEDFIVEYSKRNFFQNEIWPVKIDGEYLYDLVITDHIGVNRPKTEIIARQSSENFSSPSCRGWIDKGKIYINYLGHVLPCCMVSAMSWDKSLSGKLFQKIIKEIDSIDITKKDLKSICNSEFYQTRLKNSWQSISTAHHICVAECSKKKPAS